MAQTIYTHVKKCKNDNIKRRKEKESSQTLTISFTSLVPHPSPLPKYPKKPEELEVMNIP
jgi:hypothetical protein